MCYRIVFIVLLGLFTSNVFSQITSPNTNIHQTYKISETEKEIGKYIELPRANFIIKKGGLANHKSILGKFVKITAHKTNKKGQTIAIIELKNGMRFFNSHKYLKVDIHKALEDGVLIPL